jgi:hypothetical protein
MGALVKSERKKLWSRANQRVMLDDTRGAVRRRTLGLKKAPEAMTVDVIPIDEMPFQLQWLLVLMVLTLYETIYRILSYTIYSIADH